MAKLYQAQNPGLQGMGVVMPQKEESIGAAIANFAASALDKIAKDNFALGHAALEDDIIKTAYEMNPNDPDGFMDMVKENIAKQTKNLPGEMARKIRLNAETQARGKLVKIQNNRIKNANAELQVNATVERDNLITDISDLNDSLMDCMINNDYDGAKAINQTMAMRKGQLSQLAESKNFNGEYVFGKEAERAELKAAQYGKVDSFRKGIERLSKDGLKDFDKNIFQDKEQFMNTYGVDYKTYDEFERLIKNRRKAFDAQDKREIRAQNTYALSQLSGITDDELDAIAETGMFQEDTIKAIRKAKKAAKKADRNPEKSFGDQDQGFLATFMELQEVIKSTDDGSDEYVDKLLQAGAKAEIKIEEMRKAGLSDDACDILSRTLRESISSKGFADVLNVDNSSFISQLTEQARIDFQQKNPWTSGIFSNIDETIPAYINPMTGTAQRRPIEISDETKKALNSRAADIWTNMLVLAAQGRRDEALQLYKDGNRELIYMKYGQWIDVKEFDRMEVELANKRKAYITIGNSQYEYLGISQNDVILKGRY